MTKTVSQLLWERDSDEKWRNHRKLFKILHLEPNAKGFGGSLVHFSSQPSVSCAFVAQISQSDDWHVQKGISQLQIQEQPA